MYIEINGIDVSQNVARNSCKIMRSLQERVDSLTFTFWGNRPSEYSECRAFTAFRIESSTSTSVTLRADDGCNDLFRVGDEVFVAIGKSDEERQVITAVSYGETGIGTPTITLTVAGWDNTPSSGEIAGKREFAGVVIEESSREDTVRGVQDQTITVLSWEKLFDKRAINDVYEDRTPRYIVNDFCNTYVNYNRVVDSMDYGGNTQLRVVWTESDDGDAPILAPTCQEGLSAGRFPWTHSVGTATFTASVPGKDITTWTGIASGQPTKGVFAFWMRGSGAVEVRLGSDSSNYLSFSLTPTATWAYYDFAMKDASITGTPDWSTTVYLDVIITESSSGFIDVDGFRVLETQFFRHYPYISDAPEIDNFRVALVKPMEVMQRLADELGWFWKIDMDRYIHLFPQNTTPCPVEFTNNSDNYSNLDITYDVSRLINRQQVEGGDETSQEYYSQIVEGDGFTREWVLKNKFKGLIVRLDDGTVTDTMEVGTNTTTVVATAHGLSVGDFIVNRTLGEARKVLTVPDANTFTVEAVTGQTDGDTFSTGVDQLVGVEGINQDIGYDFMSNFNEKSIRNSDGTDTLVAGQWLTFKYFQVFPIIVARQDNNSITAVKNLLGYTDGVIDGQAQINNSLKTRSEADAYARAILDKYSNTIITARVSTYKNGILPGQEVRVQDTSGQRNIDRNFMILQVMQQEVEHGIYKYSVTCSSMLYGMLELLQQILRQQRKISVDEDQIINNVFDNSEAVEVVDEVQVTVEDNEWTWGIDPDQGRWDLSAWS